MAEIPLNGPMGAQQSRQSIGAVASYAGAVLSLALIVGIGMWGYKLLARDVSGVPVVRAVSQDPMRTVPDNPGGSEAEHQGLSVNKVMAEGGAEKPAEQLVLAPQPVTLTEEDKPLEIVTEAKPNAGLAKASVLDVDAADEPLSPQMASIKALADQLSQGVAPLAHPVGEVAKSAPAAEEVTQIAAVAPVVVDAPKVPVELNKQNTEPKVGVTHSLRPKSRPSIVKTSVSSVPPAALDALETDAASIPAGTRLVQLGAFDSPEVARKEWARLSARFEDYLEGKQRVVMRAKSGGRVFYRLRAMGFADLSDSRRFCSALVAEKADCIPVTSK